MQTPAAAPSPSVYRTPLVVVVSWLLIAAKCLFVAWAAKRWHAPVDPAWIIVPTLAFGALATGLWLTHRDET